MDFSLAKLSETYHIDVDKVVDTIRESGAKSIVLQLPEGIKPWAIAITDYIQDRLDVEVHIWMEDCFGACDVPKTETDLLIQFGHAPWDREYDVTAIDSRQMSCGSHA